MPKEKPENRSSYWFAAELGPSFDLGSLPGLAGGVQVSVIGGWRGLGLRLGGVLFPDRSNQEVGKPGGTFTLVAASAAVCGVVERPPTRLRLCAGSELGQLSGKAENTTYSWTRSSSWAAPFVEVAGSWPLFGDSFRVFGAGAAAMPLIRREFWVDNFGMVFQPGTIVGRLGLGLELPWR